MIKNFIEQTLNGLQTGSIYSLIALGYTMVYGISKLINFAHGDILMVGAYTTFYMVSKGFSVSLSLLISIALCSILGVLIERLAYRPLRNAPRMNILITAIGVSFILEAISLILAGPSPVVIPTENIIPILSSVYKVNIFGINISYLSLFIILMTLFVMILLMFYIKYTRIGKATRAVSQDSDAAKLMGINTDITIAITFAIGSGLGALGGVMYALMYPRVDPYMGLLPGLKAFIAAVFGGIGSIPGAMVGGYVMGILENYIKGYISSTWANPLVFGLLIIILIFKPNGLFGKYVKEKV